MTQASLKQTVTANAGPQTPRKPPQTFPEMIDALKAQVALALPKHLNADRMARIALTEYRKNPELAKCDPRSVFASVIMASQLGLEVGVLGQGYLIPYNKQCQFIPGWQGLVDIAQRSGRASCWTQAVFAGDEFDYAYGTNPRILHKPCGEDDPTKLTHVYAVGLVRGSEIPQIEVWPIAKVWRHRDRYNRVGRKHYSFNNPEMYARKLPLLQVLKYLPKSIELSLAVNLEHTASTFGQELNLQDAIDGTFAAVEPPTVSSDLESWSARLRAARTLESLDAIWNEVCSELNGAPSVELDEVYQRTREEIIEREGKRYAEGPANNS